MADSSPNLDPQDFEKDSVTLSLKAVYFDELNIPETASFYYVEAAEALLSAIKHGSKKPGLAQKATEYISRAENLKKLESRPESARRKTLVRRASLDEQSEGRAQFLMSQALDEDEAGNVDEACELYMQAAELCLKMSKSLGGPESSTGGSPSSIGWKPQVADPNLEARKKKFRNLATQAIERVELLKKKLKEIENIPAPPVDDPVGADSAPVESASKPSSDSNLSRSRHSAHSTPPPGGGGGGAGGIGGPGRGRLPPSAGGYSKEEIEVLRKTSIINGREYLPFMSVDLKEKFAYSIPFTDKHGKLELSPKQKERFDRWVRPDEICETPTMIMAVSSFSIRQTIVSDCSFVASLAISAAYERRFRKKLITSIIYPRNKAGEPMYNPCGKYMIKLNLNGISRKVIIDDYLPMSKDGELLCSYSNNRSELWVSLMEKAYMKVMGGYDFPGSNSNIDLHALTGWIPERISTRNDFDKDAVFNKIYKRFNKGDVLVTTSTGELTDDEADRAGLVTSHAYAMLDAREVNGVKFFQLKNPWNHLRWKGRYSVDDRQRWTPELQKALSFDPKHAAQFDNGVFWIDMDALVQFFDVFYLNWNPDLFKHSYVIHDTWFKREGPKKDLYSIRLNPQYKLQVNATASSGAVWVLLTRHITDKDDFAHNKVFFTLLVYKGGRKIYLPFDPPPMIDGVRINSPHYLCKIMLTEPGTHHYTLVVSQYEKSDTIHYTIRTYSTFDFHLTEIKEPYNPKIEKNTVGEWKGITAGGCANNRETHKNNPIYQLTFSAVTSVLIELRGPKEYSVGFDIVTVSTTSGEKPMFGERSSSGAFRKGYTLMDLDNLPPGSYNIIPSTFSAGQEGPFFLNISASSPYKLNQLQ